MSTIQHRSNWQNICATKICQQLGTPRWQMKITRLHKQDPTPRNHQHGLFHLQSPVRWHSSKPTLASRHRMDSICQSVVPNNLGASGPRGITCTKMVAPRDGTSGARRDIGNRPQRVKHEHICSVIMSHYVLFVLFKTILIFSLQLEWEIDHPNTEVGFGISQLCAVNLDLDPENIRHDQVKYHHNHHCPNMDCILIRQYFGEKNMCPVFDSKTIAIKTWLTLPSFQRPVSSASATLTGSIETRTSNNCGQECPSRKPSSSSLEQLTRKGILLDSELAYPTCTQIDQNKYLLKKNASAAKTTPNITKHKMDIPETLHTSIDPEK